MSTIAAPARKTRGKASGGSRAKAKGKAAAAPASGRFLEATATGLKWTVGTIVVYVLLGLVLLFLLENQPASFIYVSF